MKLSQRLTACYAAETLQALLQAQYCPSLGVTLAAGMLFPSTHHLEVTVSLFSAHLGVECQDHQDTSVCSKPK